MRAMCLRIGFSVVSTQFYGTAIARGAPIAFCTSWAPSLAGMMLKMGLQVLCHLLKDLVARMLRSSWWWNMFLTCSFHHYFWQVSSLPLPGSSATRQFDPLSHEPRKQQETLVWSQHDKAWFLSGSIGFDLSRYETMLKMRLGTQS